MSPLLGLIRPDTRVHPDERWKHQWREVSVDIDRISVADGKFRQME